MITDLRGIYFFLSNFYNCPVTYGGITYQNSEAAFQAQKTRSPKEREQFIDLSPKAAKDLGQTVRLHSDWENCKVQIMYEVCKAKFSQNKRLAEKLIATGDEEIVEGNDYDDRFWGEVDGKGENHLGKILMKIRDELKNRSVYTFNPEKIKNDLIKWIKLYFEENAKPDSKAVIGISGGKDSTVCAKLLVEALGTDRVVGVLMPQGEQSDIDVSRKVVDLLGIKSYEINIAPAVDALYNEMAGQLEPTTQLTFNTPARIRMTTLYGVAACVGGRVVNTCNLSEDYVGYATKFGDGAGDFSPLSNLTVTEVIAVGDALGLPYELTHKVPIDGLCGKTDEENLGFSYAILDRYIREGEDVLAKKPELKEKIDGMNKRNQHKLLPMPKFVPEN